MKKLLNTLYVTSENSYLALDGENVVVLEDKEEIGQTAAAQSGRNCFFWIPGNQSGSDGSMCGEEYFPVLSYSAGEISGKEFREE